MRKSEAAAGRCRTISTVQRMLGGKYKIEILWYIGRCEIRRFGQLRRQISEITESSLTKQLRELRAPAARRIQPDRIGRELSVRPRLHPGMGRCKSARSCAN